MALLHLVISSDVAVTITVYHILCLADTSRPRKKEEVDGHLYYYVGRDEMDDDIAGHKFIEHGEYEGHLYGTKIDSVRSIIDEDKTCVLDVSPLVGMTLWL